MSGFSLASPKAKIEAEMGSYFSNSFLQVSSKILCQPNKLEFHSSWNDFGAQLPNRRHQNKSSTKDRMTQFQQFKN